MHCPIRRPARVLPMLVALLLAACAAAPRSSTPRLINVFASSAASPWLREAYDCAPADSALRLSDPASADISLRLGESALSTLPAFQIGTEDILVVVDPNTGVRSLTLDQSRGVFSGQTTDWKDVGGSDMTVQVWTFSPGEDIAAVFNGSVMLGQPITSLARLAVSAQAMSDSVGSNPGSIGFLPRRLKARNTTEALVVASVPVLGVSSSEPQGAIRDLLTCLQANK